MTARRSYSARVIEMDPGRAAPVPPPRPTGARSQREVQGYARRRRGCLPTFTCDVSRPTLYRRAPDEPRTPTWRLG